MTATRGMDIIVVDPRGCRMRHAWARRPARLLRSFDAVCSQIKQPRRNQVWVALHEESAQWLSQSLAACAPSVTSAPLLLFCAVTTDQLSALYSGFRAVIPKAQACLSPDEFQEVMRRDHPADSCIAVAFHPAEDHLVLWRGDFTSVLVSLDQLRTLDPSGKIDPGRLALLDHGQTIALGDYELSFDAVLYERDFKYRRRANARRIDSDGSLGGCLRRLRLLKRVPRNGFEGLSEKTIARIERGEVSAPHERTLNRIARRLGVRSDEIMSY